MVGRGGRDVGDDGMRKRGVWLEGSLCKVQVHGVPVSDAEVMQRE